jgi:hypothetical protein
VRRLGRAHRGDDALRQQRGAGQRAGRRRNGRARRTGRCRACPRSRPRPQLPTRQSGRRADSSRRNRAGRRKPSAGRSLPRPRIAVQAASRCWASRGVRTPRLASPSLGCWRSRPRGCRRRGVVVGVRPSVRWTSASVTMLASLRCMSAKGPIVGHISPGRADTVAPVAPGIIESWTLVRSPLSGCPCAWISKGLAPAPNESSLCQVALRSFLGAAQLLWLAGLTWRVVGWAAAREWLVRSAGDRGGRRARWSQSRSPVALPGHVMTPLSGRRRRHIGGGARWLSCEAG